MISDVGRSEIKLAFSGPLSFTAGDHYLFKSDFVDSEGVYIWTIKNELTGCHLIHYIGETTNFGRRHREHFMNIVGLNYRIIDPNQARLGIESVVWNGMWRDKTEEAVANVIENHSRVSKIVSEYVGLINIFFAPTSVDPSLRKHIEGCIGFNLRIKHAEHKVFYPDDNQVGRQKKEFGYRINVACPDIVLGLETDYLV